MRILMTNYWQIYVILHMFYFFIFALLLLFLFVQFVYLPSIHTLIIFPLPSFFTTYNFYRLCFYFRQLARNVMFLILKSLYRRLYLIIYIMGILQKHYRDLCNLVTKSESKLTTQTITLSLGYLLYIYNNVKVSGI